MTDMWEMLRSMPAQFRWAAGLSLPELRPASEVLVAGMGGSGIAGDYAGPIAERVGVRVTAHKGYGLPRWAAATRPLVVAVSYSGDTEETLSAYRMAVEHELEIAVISGGGGLIHQAEAAGRPYVRVPTGLQPRAAIGYLLGALLRIVAQSTGVEAIAADLEEAASVTSGLLEGEGPGLNLAHDLAEGLAGRIVIVYGSEGPTGVVAGRWKTQVNENAKTPAFAGVLPEADHNEIVGWTALGGLTRRSRGAVMLRHPDESPRVAARFRLTREEMSGAVPVIGEVHAPGSSVLARMAGLTLIGDAMSIYLAEEAGIDPVSVAAIDRLKEALSDGS